MDLKEIFESDEFDFQPDGATNFLACFSPRVPESRGRVEALIANPREAIMHAFRLDKTQLGLLARTSDATLRSDLEPVFEALRAGQTVRVLSILTVAEGVEVEEPVIRDPRQVQQTQQAQQRQIVITIGRGRCKITITIDL